MDIDLNKYSHFVKAVTSDTSNNTELLIKRLKELNHHVNASLVLTSAIGLAGEAGEFAEVWKKCVFHNKALTDETLEHCKKELGDIAWYWVNACRALDLDPNDVIAANVDKLSSRYPDGVFSVERSENRQAGDI